METARHEWIVVRNIAEGHEFHATVGIVVCGALGDVFDDMAEQLHRIHVDTGFRGANVYRRADDVRFGKRLRQ